MQIDTEKVKKIIRKAISLNNGVFDKRLKKKLAEILERKLDFSQEKWTLTVPYEMNDQDTEKIIEMYHLEEKELEVKIDRKITGGFILSSSSKRIDASVKGTITNLITQTI